VEGLNSTGFSTYLCFPPQPGTGGKKHLKIACENFHDEAIFRALVDTFGSEHPG
jgi:hypothetical protein